MIPVEIIETEKRLSEYLKKLISSDVRKLALDLEGDQGSIRYKYSISIIQCFDGNDAVILDIKKIGNSPVLKELLTNPAIDKVMFSSRNDIFMSQNVLGYSIEPIKDIAVAQKLLGLKENITEHIGIDKNKKDSFQRANWLKRPLKPELIEYAVNDVLQLLRIESEFEKLLIQSDLFELYLESCTAIPKKNYRMNPLEQYKNKFPGYRRLSIESKENARIVWIFREFLGEYYNCPSGYIFSKKIMNDIIQERSTILEKLESELNSRRSRNKKIDRELIIKLYEKAVKKAEKIR